MMRKFVCNKYNGYSIRNHYFKPNPTGRGCYLETDDPDVIALIESVDNYGVDIHPAETVEEIEAMKAREAAAAEPEEEEEDEPIAHQGARGTGTTRRQRKGQVYKPGGGDEE